MLSAWCRVLVALAAAYVLGASPVTLPHRSDADIHKVIPDYFDSKAVPRHYHNATVYDDKTLDGTTLSVIDASASCKLELNIIWSAHVASPVISTPVIFPTGSEGRKEMFFATFYDNVEVLENTGHKPWGWPMTFEDSTFLSSPVLYDIDADGKNDVGVVDKNANIFFLRLGDYGQYLEDFHVQVGLPVPVMSHVCVFPGNAVQVLAVGACLCFYSVSMPLTPSSAIHLHIRTGAAPQGEEELVRRT